MNKIEQIYELGDRAYITGTRVPVFIKQDLGDEVIVTVKMGNEVIDRKLPKNQITKLDDYLAVADICRIFGLSRQRVSLWMDKGRVPSFYVVKGKKKYRCILSKDVEQLLKWMKIPPNEKKRIAWRERKEKMKMKMEQFYNLPEDEQRKERIRRSLERHKRKMKKNARP